MMTRKNFFSMLAFIPLVVFLRVARYGQFTDEAWMRAFVAGAALSALVLALYAFRRVPVRDILLASSLLLILGGAAFLAGIGPVLAVYKNFQGSVFIALYLGLRLFLLFFPGLLSGYVHDPYERAPKLAASLLAVVLAWSFFYKSILVSTVLPVTAVLLALSYVCRRAAPRREGRSL